MGGRSGRIILLGDGTEVLTESDETEMFDHDEEDKDLESQVSKGQPHSTDERRSDREDTPAPQAEPSSEQQRTPELMDVSGFFRPASTTSENSASTLSPAAQLKPAANDSTIPTKLVNPSKET